MSISAGRDYNVWGIGVDGAAYLRVGYEGSDDAGMHGDVIFHADLRMIIGLLSKYDCDLILESVLQIAINLTKSNSTTVEVFICRIFFT